ncbi:MAG TPA: hypothetical protein VEC12_07730 [Bacteroidia bacterium]|nr:hypothetical protein [Bacteroidia bacterium]
MCAGGFRLDNAGLYKVAFDVINASGNVVPWKGKPIIFTRPTPEHYRH